MKKMFMIILYVVLAIIVIAGIIVAFHPAFGRSPRGEMLERIKHSPHYRDGSFQNLQETPSLTSDKNFISTFWDFLTKKGTENTLPDHPLEAVKTDLNIGVCSWRYSLLTLHQKKIVLNIKHLKL